MNLAVCAMVLLSLGQAPPVSPAASQPARPVAPPEVLDRQFAALQAAINEADQAARSPGSPAARTSARVAALGEVLKQAGVFIELAGTDPRLADVWAYRLAAKFQLLLMTGQSLEDLRAEAKLAQADPRSDPRVQATAGYYILRADLAKLPHTASAPAGWTSAETRLTRQYLAQYPDSPYAPELMTRLADLAAQGGDSRSAITLYRNVVQRYPQHPMARKAGAAAARLELVGQPLEAEFTTPAGQKFRLSDFAGRWVAIAFLSKETPDGPETVAALYELTQRVPDLGVVLVSVDDTAANLIGWQSAWTMGVAAAWPVHFDGRRFDGPLLQRWGVRQLPTVWLVTPRGVLATTDALVDAHRLLFTAAPASQPGP